MDVQNYTESSAMPGMGESVQEFKFFLDPPPAQRMTSWERTKNSYAANFLIRAFKPLL